MSVMAKIESGIQLLARLTKRPNVKKFHPILFQDGPVCGDFIEIYSDTCTSHLLIDIISEALIQTKLKGEPAGVLIFETDGNLNLNELINVIREKISLVLNSQPNLFAENVQLDEYVHETLTNLYVSNIYDVSQFYPTIYNLESTLVEHPNISMVCFNTLTSFYWSEQGFKLTKMDLYTKNLIKSIQKITNEYKIVCLYTRPEYFSTNKDSESVPTEVKYQIQLLHNGKENYQVNIRTGNVRSTKFFKVKNSDYRWI